MQSDGMPQGVIFFDDVCALCHWSVRFILAHDHNKIFQLAPLNSKTAEGLLKPADREGKGSMLVMWGEVVLDRSDAVISIFKSLPGGWFYLGSVLHFVPKFFRDAVYAFVAARRYRWFGRYDICPIPTPELRERMLE